MKLKFATPFSKIARLRQEHPRLYKAAVKALKATDARITWLLPRFKKK